MNTHIDELEPHEMEGGDEPKVDRASEELSELRQGYEDEKKRIQDIFAETVTPGGDSTGGEFNIEIGNIHVDIVIDSTGKVKYELFEKGLLTLSQENAYLDEVFANIENQAFTKQEQGEAQEEQETGSGTELEVASEQGTLGFEGAEYLQKGVLKAMGGKDGLVGELATAIGEADIAALSAEGLANIERIEDKYNAERDSLQERAAKNRLGIVGAALERGLEFLDLDTREKVFAAALEVIPYVGAVYAVAGKRLTFERNESGVPIPKLEDINWTDRGLYLAGELFVSGHVLRGIKQAILSHGVKEFVKATGKLAAKKTGQVLVKRAQTGARREITQLRGAEEAAK